ncbi:fasciclin domain-containing protein [Altererythrobacter aquiaggeris]|uniref:fasciclin domain-containing protein n=1 Tax=Aestuarierythrobacter aquiaggeris TaxID=1898396 RepID=UPI003017F2E4
MPKFKALILVAAATIGSGALISGSPALADHHDHNHTRNAPTIVTAAQGTGVHNTLVAAVVAAGLADTLSSPGPFTVFAPTDTAFAKLPEGTVETLLRDENKGALTTILTYHAVAGNIGSQRLTQLIRKGGGSATIDTIAGEKLTARISGDTIVITDASGGTAAVTQADVRVSNGVIHVTDGVFLPG